MIIRQFFTPLKGCALYASENNPYEEPFKRVGVVVQVDGSLLKFKAIDGSTQDLIWRFKEGNNKYYIFGA